MVAYELIRPDSPDLAQRGVDCLIAGPEGEQRTQSFEARRRREFFRDYCRDNNLDLKCQRVALANGQAVAACLWVPNKGKTALFYIPDLQRYPDAIPAVESCIRGALADSAAAGMALAQCLLETDDRPAIEVFHASGFSDLSILYYMEHGRPFFTPRPEFPPGVELQTYTPARHEQFAAVIAASYIGTLDCPALSGLRRIEDVIAGHQAVGAFDPSLWLLALRDGKPAGVLLMALHPQRECLEIVYLGLAPEARRQKLGTALMQTALKTTVERGATISTLAVDQNNTPALRLYQRLRYRKTGQRRALYKSL
ncbi:MAG TPA: GNAT family N-acetyltransferase [Phycisphaerae bacterium]|nr:GNAT family N-acetyltransferase [Phycisphaerae bacterium]